MIDNKPIGNLYYDCHGLTLNEAVFMRCSFYIPETDYFYGNLADSRDLYSHVPTLSDRQLHRRQEGGIGAKESRRADRAGRGCERGCQLRGQGAGQAELAQVQG
jgi:hypothetical protein